MRTEGRKVDPLTRIPEWTVPLIAGRLKQCAMNLALLVWSEYRTSAERLAVQAMKWESIPPHVLDDLLKSSRESRTWTISHILLTYSDPLNRAIAVAATLKRIGVDQELVNTIVWDCLEGCLANKLSGTLVRLGRAPWINADAIGMASAADQAEQSMVFDVPRLYTFSVNAWQVKDRFQGIGFMDIARLRILSDALEEHGAPGNMVKHLRENDIHMQGCWVVDAILGRE